METIMHKEIFMIPEALRFTYEYNEQILKEVANKIKEKNIKNVSIVARGSSDNVGLYLKYLLEIYCHMNVSLASSSIVTKYGSYINFSDTLVIGISQSGSGEDIKEFLKMANEQGALTLAITNNLNSICAKEAKYNFYLNLSEEKGLAATKTFISQLYLSLLFVNELCDGVLQNSIDTLPKKINEVLDNEKNIDSIAEKCTDFIDLYLLSRGLNLVSSMEGILKIQETTYIKAKAYAISDFYHGPMAIADEKQNFFLLASKGKVSDDNFKMYEKLKELNVNLFLITNDERFFDETNLIKIPDCDEVISPFATIVSIQLFANKLATLRGIDVDHPRNLKKVTVTR